jgi:Protein kinase domain
MAAQRARKFGRWVITRDLKEGGQGWAYLVAEEGREDQGERVLKRLKNIKRIDRFRREIHAGDRLSHPNIVRVIESSPDTDPAYLVTEYCSGGVLSPAAVSGKTLIERLTMFRAICEGVAYAHTQGVVHRDLKPDNIFLQADGTPKVGDFGLCFFEETGERFTLLEEAVGPRWYMAPELESGRVVTVLPASDVYSLGKLLYWTLATKTFARERHRAPENDLSRNGADFGMKLVYELLDKMIVEDISQRLPNAGVVISELDAIRSRIELRGRAVELARAPLPASLQKEVRIACFRVGSLPDWHTFDPCNATVLGFAARGQFLAACGVASHGEGASECLAWVGGPRGGWETRAIEVRNPCRPQAAGAQALTVDERGASLVVVGINNQPGGNRTAYLVRLTAGRPATVTTLAANVAAPRHSAVATSRGDRVAVYLAPWEPSRDGQGGTFVREPTGELLHLISPRTDFPGPLAFDGMATLHQAVVHSLVVEKKEVRQLHYRWKPPGEPWSEMVVDSISEGLMGAHISLAITPAGFPVITGSSTDARALVVYAKENTTFSKYEIDLRLIAESFAISSFDASGTKQFLFDEESTMHIAMISNGDILYLALDQQRKVIEQRDFPASELLGIGIDSSGNIHIAMQ